MWFVWFALAMPFWGAIYILTTLWEWLVTLLKWLFWPGLLVFWAGCVVAAVVDILARYTKPTPPDPPEP